MDIRGLIMVAEEAAIKAGDAIMTVYRTGEFETELKADHSPVTKADKEAHRIITDHLIQTNIPVISEEGKENRFTPGKAPGYFWLIDPLDGTKEFISGNGEFTVNIALIHDHKPILGVINAPCLNKIFSGSVEYGAYKVEAGKKTFFTSLSSRKLFTDLVKLDRIRIAVSRSHMTQATENFIKQFKNATLMPMGSSLKFVVLAGNEADIYPRLEPTMEWDTAAGHALLSAVNKGLYNLDLRSEITYYKPQLKNQSFIAF